MSKVLSEIVSKLDRYCCVHLAEKWDNVGLLLEPTAPHSVKKILVTNDLTENVVDEASNLGAGLIISYHPPIFTPLKRLTQAHWKQRVIARCFEKGMAIYSPHTGLDAKVDGLNDWLLSPFDLKMLKPLVRCSSKCFVKKTFYVRLTEQLKTICLQNDIEINNACPQSDGSTLCSITVPMELAGNLEITLNDNKIAIDHTTVLDDMDYHDVGGGRVGLLEKSKSIAEVVEAYKRLFEIEHLKVALGRGQTMTSAISSIAVCAGSGGQLFGNAPASHLVDLFVSGEISHHEQLDLTAKGATVITAGHSVTERIFLRDFFVPWLQGEFPTVPVKMSTVDKEPGDIL